jgi:N-acetylglucosamine malate deacetylase 1
MPQDPLRIMAFGAHPPDVVGRAGGTLAKHARRGDIVMAACLTDGVRHMNPALARAPVVGPEAVAQVAEIKRAEMVAACRALGVQHLRFLDLRDSPLPVDQTSLRAVSDLIREFRPDIILTHHPEETYLTGHPDHGAAGDLVLRAYMMAMELGFESHLLPLVVNNLYTYEGGLGNLDGPGLAHVGRPTLLVDISEVIEAKKQALLALGATMRYNEESVARSLAQTRGREGIVGAEYVEGFCALHTPIVDYLERRSKGRWLPGPQPPEWQALSLWPEE